MKNYDRSGGWFGGLQLIAMIVGLIVVLGWWVNVFKFASSDFEAPFKPEIVRAVGVVVPPVGVAVGFVDLEGE